MKTGNGDLDRRLDLGVGQDLLGLLDVELERSVGQRAGETNGQEGLVNLALAAQQVLGDAVIVDEIARRLPEGGVAERRIGLGVDEEVVGAGRGNGEDR